MLSSGSHMLPSVNAVLQRSHWRPRPAAPTPVCQPTSHSSIASVSSIFTVSWWQNVFAQMILLLALRLEHGRRANLIPKNQNERKRT